MSDNMFFSPMRKIAHSNTISSIPFLRWQRVGILLPLYQEILREVLKISLIDSFQLKQRAILKYNKWIIRTSWSTNFLKSRCKLKELCGKNDSFPLRQRAVTWQCECVRVAASRVLSEHSAACCVSSSIPPRLFLHAASVAFTDHRLPHQRSLWAWAHQPIVYLTLLPEHPRGTSSTALQLLTQFVLKLVDSLLFLLKPFHLLFYCHNSGLHPLGLFQQPQAPFLSHFSYYYQLFLKHHSEPSSPFYKST